MPTRTEINTLISTNLANVSDITAAELREVFTSVANYLDQQDTALGAKDVKTVAITGTTTKTLTVTFNDNTTISGSFTDLQATGGGGVDGREVELQKSATHIQWRYVGEVAWVNLVALADITGPQGAQGEPGAGADYSTSIAYTASIPFTKPYTRVANHVQTANIILTPNTAGAIVGAATELVITPDEDFTIDTSAFELLSNSQDVLNGIPNRFLFYYDGTDYLLCIVQKESDLSLLLDADFLTWFTAFEAAGGILSAGHKAAINAFTVGIKSDGIWDLPNFRFYPLRGATAATTAIALKGANIVWGGTPVFAATGVKGDGTSAYGNTGLTPQSIGQTSIHIAYYARLATINSGTIIGSSANADDAYVGLTARDTIAYVNFAGSGTADYSTATNTTSIGRYIAYRDGATKKLLVNGVDTTLTTGNGDDVVNSQPLYLFANNQGGSPLDFSLQELGVASIGGNFTSLAQAQAYDARLSTLITALGI